MSQIKKVALAGATGNLGPSILSALLRANFEVTALTRSLDKPFPDGVKVEKVDYSSKDSLVNALKGHDAVVSTLGAADPKPQIDLIDAAIAAGVSRFIPSEFGSDSTNHNVVKLPFYSSKYEVEKHLTAAADAGKISYTMVSCGPFLDWCIMVGLTINPKERKIELYDGGDVPFSTTRLSVVGDAVASALKLADKTKNKHLKVHDIVTTQNEMLALGKEVTGTNEWEVTHADTKVLADEAMEKLKTQGFDQWVALAFIKRAIWGTEFGGEYKPVDNEMLGIPLMTKEELKGVVGQYA